jgi:hypothetical protein
MTGEPFGTSIAGSADTEPFNIARLNNLGRDLSRKVESRNYLKITLFDPNSPARYCAALKLNPEL